jgi:DNA-binding NtrC family response regulator
VLFRSEGINDKARSCLYAYDWPGNVRELRNCIESAVVMAERNLITEGDLPPTLRHASEDGWIRIPLGTSLEEAERIIIRDTLSSLRGNKSKTAEALGIGRKTLHRRLTEAGEVDEEEDSEEDPVE